MGVSPIAENGRDVKPCDSPILLLVFNRPETTQQVFESIRRAKPVALFIAADGPRSNMPGEVERCRDVREIVSLVDWECEVHHLYREENLGCRLAVSSAIDWFFDHVESGIILEDDCLPSDSFYHFCGELLDYYKDDERVMMISGDNFQDGIQRGEASYYFSTIPWIWGWATWRRAWNKYDVKMASFPSVLKKTALRFVSDDVDVRNYWLHSFVKTYEGIIGTWDYQWIYCIQANHGLSICPQTNLVSNIGFLPGSTHLADADSKLSQMPAGQIGVITHPEQVIPDLDADDYQYNIYLNTRCHEIANPLMRWRKKLRRRAKVRRALNRFFAGSKGDA